MGISAGNRMIKAAPLALILIVSTLGSAQAPKTPFGQPDLQGIWSNATDIPLERPKELGSKELSTLNNYCGQIAPSL